MLHVTRDQASTVFIVRENELVLQVTIFALSSATWKSREWQLDFVLKLVKLLWKRND